MYEDYLTKFDNVLKVFAEWKSIEFRSFMNLRLENENVKKHMEAPMLCMLPWFALCSMYLYNPFERLKVYYKFLRDLDTLSKEGDEDKVFLDQCLAKFKKVYQNIKRNEKRLQVKIKLLEVQLQIHGNYKTIVKDDSPKQHSHDFYPCLTFLNVDMQYILKTVSKPCQMRRLVFHKKYKRITIHLFSDLFVWVSVRGKYKGSYSLYNRELQIEKSGSPGSGEFSIGLASEKTKRLVVCANDGPSTFFFFPNQIYCIFIYTHIHIYLCICIKSNEMRLWRKLWMLFESARNVPKMQRMFPMLFFFFLD
ncbi:hypothetical protein RFI_12046 [Reticulomyxa filosa]|uniref:DH domain-containing protein n=1 Tax=Reticulomyxa filosa TaxID=46433 RepID=X6NGR2_RETFI|nr:hypothetical protein RFI_12046 [Reticulomyxa filosa]|eukprot:ETO25098.1 hypothetical protein RFI_12046 [Reticulomyxa filosa]